jgi:hypothetical protein
MDKNQSILAVICLTLIAAIMACNMPEAGTVEPTSDVELTRIVEPTSVPVPTSGGGGNQVGECANPLYPVVTGATWAYASQGYTLGDYTFTHAITYVGPNAFTLTIEYDSGVTATLEWSCDSGNFIQMDFSNGPAGALASVGGARGSFDTEDVVGVTLPAQVSAGDTWQQFANISGEVRLPDGKGGTAEGPYSAAYTAIGI